MWACLLLWAAGCRKANADDSVFEGMCDASAAVRVGSLWVVASDEDDVLRVYDPAKPGPPVQTFDLDTVFPQPGERDIEAVVVSGPETWWVGSLGRDRDADPAPSRQRRVSTTLTAREGGVDFAVGADLSDLLDRLRTAPEWAVLGPEVEQRAPKAGGLNLEGAAMGADGTWWLGLRSPMDGPLALLAELPTLRPAELHPIDLEGRGIRDVVADGDGFLLLSGAPADAGVYSALWSWKPGTPIRKVKDLSGDLVPEALVRDSKDRWWVLSDDGSRRVNGHICKDLPLPEQRFRARLVD